MKHAFVRPVFQAAVGASYRSCRASLHNSAYNEGAAVAAALQQQACSLTSSSSTHSARTAAAATSGMSSRRSLSSGMNGADGSSSSSGGSGRFSDDLEKLISRAGEQVDRSSAKKGGAAAREAGGEASESAAEGEEGGGGEAVVDSKLSARAMKFRAMISKLRPQKKVVVVKVCVLCVSCVFVSPRVYQHDRQTRDARTEGSRNSVESQKVGLYYCVGGTAGNYRSVLPERCSSTASVHASHSTAVLHKQCCEVWTEERRQSTTESSGEQLAASSC